MSKAGAKTGAGPTVMIAIERFFPKEQRIITDDLAGSILPFGPRALVWMTGSAPARDFIVRATEKAFPGIWGGLMCRKRCIDDKLLDTVSGIDAVVNLGAGFDTRIYRLPALTAKAAWEIDQAENVIPKRARLLSLYGAVPSHVTLVSIDFDREQLGPVLSAHGYTTDKRTFFIWEGVTQYLTKIGINTTLDFLATAARGSRLAFTYVRKDFLDGRNLYGQAQLHKRFVATHTWMFGLDPDGIGALLGPYGWRLLEDLDYGALAARYVTPTGRALASTPIERVAFAEKT